MKIIGKRLFVDGVERDVFEDDDGRQHVVGPDDERVYGTWILTGAVIELTPVGVSAENEKASR